MVAKVPHPRAVPITMPNTSPMAQPARQCSVALNAVLFSEVSLCCIVLCSFLDQRTRSLLVLGVPLVSPACHLLDLPLLGVHDGPGDLPYLGVLALLQNHLCHSDGGLVVG